MDFEHNQRTKLLIQSLQAFMQRWIYPAESVYEAQMAGFGADRWQIPPIVEELKTKAKEQRLWNLFHPHPDYGAGLSNVDYAPLAEIMGRVLWAPEIFNCNPPDTGNMEVLSLYGSSEQKKKWLEPLLAGTLRSAFLMTEPDVASSDATNIKTRIERRGDKYVLNGRKWWATAVGDPRCKIFIVMGKSNPDADIHHQQSQILVPRDAKGVKIIRNLPVFGFDDAPHGHCEVLLEDVEVPAENMLLGEGRGFEIAQGRLGPGRIHHCMRTIGVAERALEMMCVRLQSRTAFGKTIAEHSVWEERIAQARIHIEMARLLTLKAAYLMDTVGNKAAQTAIAMTKVATPQMALKVIDDAIQAFGGAGVTNDPGLARAYAATRFLRIGDGPDEVHYRAIAKVEFRANRPQ